MEIFWGRGFRAVFGGENVSGFLGSESSHPTSNTNFHCMQVQVRSAACCTPFCPESGRAGRAPRRRARPRAPAPPSGAQSFRRKVCK